MASDRPQLVQALYSFKATNNDELTFKKGDVITLTQCDDADWWEGTLGDTTGWFPANYVKECSAAESQQSAAPMELVSQQRVYRSLVLQDIIDSERAHISELQTLCKNFLQPLSRSDVLSAAEYRQLTGNLDEVLGEHGRLLAELELQAAVQQRPQRAGHVFLSRAADLKRVHTQYCAGHPRAVCVLDKHKDALNAFMESQGAHTPGIMVLTTGLSKVFRRLDKFPCMLQEYERHLEEGHPDRGDTQRSIHVYNEITTSCATIRRQKETELEILSGNIRRWEGEQMANMGEIIHMGSVAVGKEHSDRYFVLFRTTLVMLSVSPRMSAFIYEGKLPLSGISVTKLEDSSDHKNAFEIAGPMIERIVAECQSRDEQQAWVSQLLGQIQAARQSAFLPSQPQPIPHTSVAPPPPPHHAPVSEVGVSSAPGPLRPWTAACLRPSPPLRPCLALGREDTNRKSSRNMVYKYKKRGDDRSYEDDATILRVIEAYCTSSQPRHTVNSSLLDPPHPIPEEQQQQQQPGGSGSGGGGVSAAAALAALAAGAGPAVPAQQEERLLESVQQLRDEVRQLRDRLDDERRRRQHLETIVRTHLLAGRSDIRWDE
ncbi:rho guanine nucleotide exchange factor 7-like isoform X2 [Amphibalanus amphitrite]|uniref:rho guanine nucleotide exchange factor 7-like isoform X2 n=1 Tax=Amphibalanus amphitrite TaxID=1232801 RepID=UPI001C91E4CA|nr:rho guanine nucleotide exchange factor 7-like isoform X2 [Amphibalanus amphitrite]